MLHTVIDIAKGAGRIIIDMQTHGFEVMKKSDTGNEASDIVTEADFAADTYIIHALQSHFPGEQILTEEIANEVQQLDWSKPVWIVDPLDGTKNFSEGKDIFGVLIGRVEKGVPVLGVAHFPRIQKTYYAQKDAGAFCNEETIYIDEQQILVEAKTNDNIMIAGGTITHLSKDTIFSGIASAKCIGWSLCSIASGTYGGVIRTHTQGGKRDTCAPQIILEEAGGSITNTKGDVLDYTQAGHYRGEGYCAGTLGMHKQLLAFLS